MDLEKIGFYIKVIFLSFSQMPEHLQKTVIAALIGMGGMVYGLVISPIIFNLFLIPRIEKRLGKKLKYSPVYKYFFLNRWMVANDDISFYIVKAYLRFKITGLTGTLSQKKTGSALVHAGYDIKDAEKIEIIFSFIQVFSILMTIIAALVFLYMSRQLDIFLTS